MIDINQEFKIIIKSRLLNKEKLVMAYRKSRWFYGIPLYFLIISVLTMLIVNNIYGYMYQDIEEIQTKIFLIGFLSLIFGFLVWFLIAFKNRNSVQLAITSKRVIIYDEDGPIEVPYANLDHTKPIVKFLPSIFGYGNIDFYTKQEEEKDNIVSNFRKSSAITIVPLKGVPMVKDLTAVIKKLSKEDAKNRLIEKQKKEKLEKLRQQKQKELEIQQKIKEQTLREFNS